MNTLSTTATKSTAGRLPIVSPLIRPGPPSLLSIAFQRPRQIPSLKSVASIRASSQNPIDGNADKNFGVSDKSSTLKASSFSFLGPLKAGLTTTVASVALILAGAFVAFKPLIAAPVAPPLATPASVGTQEENSVADEEKEKILEEYLVSNPYDVDGLKALMEIKIKGQKVTEAIEILNKLTEIEPEKAEWPLMKSHLYSHIGEFELAKNGFKELLKKDSFRVEAYHGLVLVASQEEASEDMGKVEKMVEEAMNKCKKEHKLEDLRDFKLLLAQIRVLQSRYDEALKVYQELVKDEPRDFRPYLCQGIIYTLLRKNNEAEQNFEKYRRLIPKGHPYATYFDDNMIATKLFAQKMENEREMEKA